MSTNAGHDGELGRIIRLRTIGVPPPYEDAVIRAAEESWRASINRLPDYEAAVDALEVLLHQFPEADPGSVAEAVLNEARAALRRLREGEVSRV